MTLTTSSRERSNASDCDVNKSQFQKYIISVDEKVVPISSSPPTMPSHIYLTRFLILGIRALFPLLFTMDDYQALADIVPRLLRSGLIIASDAWEALRIARRVVDTRRPIHPSLVCIGSLIIAWKYREEKYRATIKTFAQHAELDLFTVDTAERYVLDAIGHTVPFPNKAYKWTAKYTYLQRRVALGHRRYKKPYERPLEHSKTLAPPCPRVLHDNFNTGVFAVNDTLQKQLEQRAGSRGYRKVVCFGVYVE
jgi:hypothetical protein